MSRPSRDIVANQKNLVLDTLAIGSTASERLLIYALEPIGLHKGYIVIQCITRYIIYMIKVFLHVSMK